MSLLPNALHVARREYLVRVRTRAFRITTAILAVVAAIVVMLPAVLTAIGVDDPARLAVASRTDELPVDPVELVRRTYEDPEEAAELVTEVTDVDAARQEVREEALDGLLVIERDAGGELRFELFSDAGPTSGLRLRIQQVAQQLAEQDRLAAAGVSAEDRARIGAPVAFEVVAPDGATGGPAPDEFGASFILAWAVLVLTFMAILTYGNWVAQSVAEEKSNRVMELLVTAATPRQLLAGKVLGTGAAGLTQYVIVLLVAATAFVGVGPLEAALGIDEAGGGLELPAVHPAWVAAFTAFFIGGFLLYATLYAAAGSMVSRIEDVQQAAGPLLLLAMGGYFTAVTAINVPDAGWVAVASMIPFFSPYLMPIRLLLGSPPGIVEVLVALLLLAITLALAVWLAARIYSAGVLLYGQRIGVRSALRAARVDR